MKIFPLYTCKINFIGVHFRLFLFQRVGRMREGEGYSPIRGGEFYSPLRRGEGDRVRPGEGGGANAIRPYGGGGITPFGRDPSSGELLIK